MELLIAISIFSIIALCLYSTFSGGIQIWKRQEKAFRHSHNVRLALDNMAKELKNAINYSQRENETAGLEEEEDLKFSGDEENLTFITLIGAKIAKVDYEFFAEEGVLRKNVAFQEEGFKRQNQKDDIFIEGLEDLAFEYAYIEDKEDSEPEWYQTWPKDATAQSPKIPLGVRITAVFQEPGQKEKQGKQEIFRKTVFMPMGSL